MSIGLLVVLVCLLGLYDHYRTQGTGTKFKREARAVQAGDDQHVEGQAVK